LSKNPNRDFQSVFWSTKRALAQANATAFERHGVYEGQQYILLALWATDGRTPGELARQLGLATPTVTRATARMEAAGLVHRARDNTDRRLVRILLTRRGKALEKAIGEEMDRLSERALASLEPAQRSALVDALQRVRHNLS
jgi:DNA-binding MarR family transcriptional regulator